MFLAKVIALGLACLAWALMIPLFREMSHGDGFGRSMARSVAALDAIALWICLSLAWLLTAWDSRVGTLAWILVGSLLVAAFCATWMAIPKIGSAGTSAFAAGSVLAAPLVLIAQAWIAAVPAWQSVVPHAVIVTGWTVAGAASVWPWIRIYMVRR
ncbi:MAG: hypothetical protein IAE82_11080 [Opitutaceae bacterium]|nr:hypothetical protein [Opitutaceae bacterium]